MTIKQRTLRLTTIAAAVALAGCSWFDDDDDEPTTTPPVEPVSTYVRVLHAVPDAPKVNVLVNGSAALQSVDYPQSSGLIELEEGDYDLDVEAIIPGGNAVVISAPDTGLAGDMEYNILAVGTVAGDSLEPLIVAREVAEVPADAVHLQVVHAAANAPAVDIYVTAPDGTLDAPTFAAVAFKGNSAETPVPPGSYRVRITPAGSETVVYDSGTIDLSDEGGKYLLVAAITNTEFGDSPVHLAVLDGMVTEGSDTVLIRDVNQGSELRVIHTVDDAPAVDVWVNGAAPEDGSPLQNLGFGEFTDYLGVPAGSYDLAVAPTGATEPLVIDAQDVALAAGQAYSVIAVGELANVTDETIEPYIVLDNPRSIATEAQVRVIHAASRAPAVDVYVTATTDISTAEPVLSAVPFEMASGYLSVAPGTYQVTVTVAGDRNAVAIGPAEVSVTAGGIFTAVAHNNGEGFGLLLMDDFVSDETPQEPMLGDCSRTADGSIGPIGEDMWLRGTFDGKDFVDLVDERKLIYTGDNIYQVVVSETAGNYGFKFAAADWSPELANSGGGEITIGSEMVLATAGFGVNATIDIPADGDYVYSFEINGTLNGGRLLVAACPQS
ncbi:MAG: DUF4397 domain-containing protein [Gammaproteobacteria bacterium]|nr:DUF4397 domain-containing protein [Gammaproteobacteria bacterium]